MTHDGGKFPFDKSLDDVEALARRAVVFRTSSPLTFDERLEIARDTVVELLYSDRAGEVENLDGFLVRSAQNAVRNAHNRAIIESPIGTGREGRGRMAAAYLYGSRDTQPDFTEDLVEVLAVRETWLKLTPDDREVLALYLHYENVSAAAYAYGASRTSYYNRFTEAKKSFAKLFESPLPKKGTRVRLRRRGVRPALAA